MGEVGRIAQQHVVVTGRKVAGVEGRAVAEVVVVTRDDEDEGAVRVRLADVHVDEVRVRCGADAVDDRYRRPIGTEPCAHVCGQQG